MNSTELKPAIIIVFKWIVLWLGLGTFHSYVLRPLWGLDGSNALVSIYFFACAVLALYIYRVKSFPSPNDPLKKQSLFILICTLVVVALSFVFNYFYPIDASKIEFIKKELFSFPLFQLNTWVAKWSDVAYQQVMLVCVLTALNSLSISTKEKVVVSSIGFALLHFPLLVLFGWRGFYFIVPSIFAGFIFTYLILHYKRGLFYSFAVHLSFYLVLGIIIRLIV